MTDHAGLRVGIVADLLEEGWPSMDLVAEMLLSHLSETHFTVNPVLMRPALRPRLARFWNSPRSRTADRIVNRFYDYPRWLRARGTSADVFHVVDHSYAHLVEALPPGRVVVTCHDTDAFLPVLDGEPTGSMLPRRLVRRLVRGLQRADMVACVSETTRQALVGSGLMPRDRTAVVPNGVHPACSPDPDERADRAAAALLGPVSGVELLHVGSTIPRKRADVLLRTLRAVADRRPDVRLIRVGGPWTPAQQRLASDLGVADRVAVMPPLDRAVLGAVYRRAALLLLPSEREGFGLPVVEALACGTAVVATDLDVLKEVGGAAVTYAPLGDVAAWADTVSRLLDERERAPADWAARRAEGIRRAASFSWRQYAADMTALYTRLAG